jgi:hypothetical protein
MFQNETVGLGPPPPNHIFLDGLKTRVVTWLSIFIDGVEFQRHTPDVWLRVSVNPGYLSREDCAELEELCKELIDGFFDTALIGCSMRVQSLRDQGHQ